MELSIQKLWRLCSFRFDHSLCIAMDWCIELRILAGMDHFLLDYFLPTDPLLGPEKYGSTSEEKMMFISPFTYS